MNRLPHLLLGAVLGAALAACGGAGNTVAEGGIGGTGISSGSISAFSSIVVNGTKFDVNAAEITVNGRPAMQGDLDVGYVVRVDGDLTNRVADSVQFEANVIGEVDSNASLAGEDVGTLVAAQQTVRVTATTVLDGVDTPDQILVGDRVLVSGFRNSSGELVATHVQVGPSDGDQVVGRVTPVDATRFRIGNLVVVSNANVDAGDRVLVRGQYDPTVPELRPDSVEIVEDLVVGGTEIELESIVNIFFSNANFEIDGIPVDASEAEIVDEAGNPAPNGIKQDVEVEVEGVFNAFGLLVAERVEVELEDDVEIVAQVVNDPDQDGPVQFFLDGTPWVTVNVTDKTELRDKSIQDVVNFGVADLAQNDWVEVDASEDPVTGEVTALKIERIDPETTVAVEGTLDSLPSFSILGMTFDTGSADLTGIAEGDIVEVTWSASATFIQPDMPVDSVEKED